jgi:hypothetical protein
MHFLLLHLLLNFWLETSLEAWLETASASASSIPKVPLTANPRNQHSLRYLWGGLSSRRLCVPRPRNY